MEKFVIKGAVGGAVLGMGLVLFYLRSYTGEDLGAMLFLFGTMVVTFLSVAGGAFFALNWNCAAHFHAEEARRLAERARRAGTAAAEPQAAPAKRPEAPRTEPHLAAPAFKDFKYA